MTTQIKGSGDVNDGGTDTALVSGLAKAFGVLDMSDNSVPDSFNISSFTDRGTGSLYGNYTSAMASASHTVVGNTSPTQEGAMGTTNGNRHTISSSDTAARYSQNAAEVTTATSMTDNPYMSAVVYGGLA